MPRAPREARRRASSALARVRRLRRYSMGNVFFSVGMSLDGFMAPEGMDLAHADDPNYKDWLSQWNELQKWMFQQRFFRENLKLGEGGEIGQDNRILEETFKRTGVSIMGKRMFDGGEHYWPEEAPFHTPGLVDEFSIALAPVFFGEGLRLFDGIDRRTVALEIVEAIHSPLVTHLRYAVTKQ